MSTYKGHILCWTTWLFWGLVGQNVAPAQDNRVQVSGYVENASSRERLKGATLFDSISEAGAISNDDGFFSLSLIPGNVALHVAHLGFSRYHAGTHTGKRYPCNLLSRPSNVLAGRSYRRKSSGRHGCRQCDFHDPPINFIVAGDFG